LRGFAALAKPTALRFLSPSTPKKALCLLYKNKGDKMRRNNSERLAIDLLTYCGEPPRTEQEALKMVHAMYECAAPRFARSIAKKVMKWR
jgi:hypothetical protein